MLIYLFSGPDPLAKDREIAGLKNKILKSDQAFQFDYEVLHAHKLNSADLKKTLVSLPAVAAQRLVVIRECQRLDTHNKKIITEFVHSKDVYAVLVLDYDELDSRDAFVKGLGAGVKVTDFSRQTTLNVFDLTKAISMRKSQEALKILADLLEEGIHPLQIMGGLVWFWGNGRTRMGPKPFERGLLALQEADLNIKRSRLRPEYALELLVVKLCSPESAAS